MNNSDDIDGKMIQEYRLNKFREMDAKLEKDVKNTRFMFQNIRR